MLNDLRYAVRTLLHAPAFAAIAVITLALGIGANTAIFSVVHAVLLAPLPYPDASRLVALHEALAARPGRPDQPSMPLTPATTKDWAASRSFTSIAAYSSTDFILTGAGEPERVRGASVSGDFFDTLRVKPTLGRALARPDEHGAAGQVAVISDRLWRTRFGARPSLVGSTVELSDRRYAVVGIAPAGFSFPAEAQIWVPLDLPPSEFADNQRLSFYLDAIGRLAGGVTPAQAQADLNAITAGVAARFPAHYEGRSAVVTPLREDLVGEYRAPLLLLLGTVGLVLLVACVNVANLLLTRGSSREAEIAIRAALGANRARLLRQLLAESLLLAAAGAAAGVTLALWVRDAIVALAPAAVPRLSDVSINLPVLGFTALLVIVTTVAFGAVPAALTARQGLGRSLKAARRVSGGVDRRVLHRTLVIVELALSLALLTGAGLLARTFFKLVDVDPGFDASRVMTMELVLPRPKYADPARRAAFFSRVVNQLQANPLVEAAGGATNLPLSNTDMTYGFYRQDMAPDRDVPFEAGVRGITSGYFDTMRIPILRGRDLTSSDREGSPPVVLINDAMRRRYWPDADPMGQRLAITRGRTTVWREIVGIVGDVRHADLRKTARPEIYMPFAQDPFMFMRIAVRSSAAPDVLAGAMRAAVWAEDPAQPVSRVRPMSAIVSASMSEARFNTVLIASFAALGLGLAAIGLYGVIASGVARRQHEFGVRIALGADRAHVLRLVLSQGLALGTGGLAAGLGLAALVGRVVAARLYDMTPLDPVTYAAVAATLLLVTLVASYVPARRAMSADPMTSLRAE